ncbi:MAG: efflux RND transporter permease subunit, partial [Methyloceanibacter sp.]|nr:efflux RND transporter permease subunit [Methyloceanibacter sp.]
MGEILAAHAGREAALAADTRGRAEGEGGDDRIGIVVDDAIVVMENIYVKVEQGMNPVEAGLAGSKEIYFAI